jgi:hypothetical protein
MARLLFIAMWNFADDGGVVPASPKRFKRHVFASDDVTIEQVAGWIEQLVANKLVSRFDADGESWLRILGWHHQKIQKPTFQYPRSKEFYSAAQERRKRFENRTEEAFDCDFGDIPHQGDDESATSTHQGDDESATSTHQGDDSSPPNRSEGKRSEVKNDDDDDCDRAGSEPLPPSQPAPPEHPSGPEAWKRAFTACQSIGVNTIGSGFIVDLARQRGIPPADVVEAAGIARDGPFTNPPGALDHWVKSHKRGRDVADPLSWPVRVHRAQKPAKADPERQRSKVLFEALQAAKAGNLDDAVKLLTNAKFDRKDWPEFVLSKLEKV